VIANLERLRPLAEKLAVALELTVGRERFARGARWFWLRSRLDLPNDPATNGERAFQRSMCADLARELRPISVFDVGANVGTWSRSFLRAWAATSAPERLVLHAFEPSPGARDLLENCEAAFASSGHRFFVVAAAAGDVEGIGRLHVVGPKAGTNSLIPLTRNPNMEIDVEIVRVDAYCERQGVGFIDVLKVDAEGYDLPVLAGARSMLEARAVRWVQFEYNHRWIASRHFLRDVFELAKECGYQVGKLTPRGVEHYPDWHPELESFREGNYVLWHDRLPKGMPVIPWWLDTSPPG
jgi:FkbM family methyltransferase